MIEGGEWRVEEEASPLHLTGYGGQGRGLETRYWQEFIGICWKIRFFLTGR
jgi:hypothetical protein